VSGGESEGRRVGELFDLHGRAAIVTGGARGLGREHAFALAEAGADVAICDLLEAEGEATRSEIEARGVRSISGKIDVTVPAEIDRFIARVEEELGPIRILVNNAARPSEGVPLETVDDDLWRRIIDTNLSSVFYFGKRAALRMIERRTGGSIINISSMNAFVVSNIAPRHNVTYCVAKAGIVQLTKGMAAEWAPHGIRVNALAPGYILTQQTAASAANPEIYARNVASTPMKRYGRLDELKGAIVYLASDASSFMTGAALVVDGGYTIW
jgi:NAD(P)-dependent dehydrogenase (short-subunit alcohol dehydrogenase family)